jgi:DNA-binding transcriptional ArsR family regulator
MEHLDAAFSALADPTRRAILAQLAQGETMVTDLGRPFLLSQPAISRHIKVLERAGLIRRRTVGTKRLCSLRAPALNELEQWLHLLRRALEANYARLDDLLLSLDASGSTSHGDDGSASSAPTKPTPSARKK